MNEKDLDQQASIRRTKKNAKRALGAIKAIKDNPNINWFYTELLTEEIETADSKIHIMLSSKGGDLGQLQRLQAEIDIRKGLIEGPQMYIEAEKDMKKELKRQKDLEE